MHYQINSVELFPDEKLLKVESQQIKKAAYFEIHSRKFKCLSNSQLTPQLSQIAQCYSSHAKRYLKRRNFLFKKFDEGIQFDEESLYSIIPEEISQYLKIRLKQFGASKICEPFCGVGGIAVHLCEDFDLYAVNDIDKSKLRKLKHNINIYGKKTLNLKEYALDFLELQPFETDVMIICPPWGGINVADYAKKDLDSIMCPPLSQILKHAYKFSNNVILQMPKNTKIENLVAILLKSQFPPNFTIQKIYRNKKVEQLFIYLGSPKFTKISSKSIKQMHELDIEELDAKTQNKNEEVTKKQIQELTEEQNEYQHELEA